MTLSRIALVALVLLAMPGKSPLAQDYHSPAQVLEIMNASTVTYEFSELQAILIRDGDVEVDLPLNSYGVYLDKKNKDGVYELKVYELSPEVTKLLEAGESGFQSNEMGKARAAYFDALELMPNNSQLMTFVGQTYDVEIDFKSAKKWYKKAIKENYLDYMAHWFLADIYLQDENLKKAVKEITIAHILNRNNPRIMVSLLNIYDANETEYAVWEFKPKYEVSKSDGDTVSLKYDPKYSEWLAYMLCKAIWAYEPGYKEGMVRDTQEAPRMVEEKECLFCAVVTEENKKDDTASSAEWLIALQGALERGNIEEFILYEVLLKEDPSIAFRINKKAIKRIADYISRFRTHKS